MGVFSSINPAHPYVSAVKLVVGIALLGLVVGFIWSWHDRGRQIETLKATQDAIVQAATVATVKPDENGHREALRPADVPAAIAALSSSLHSADEALRWISAETLSAKQASDVADGALDRDLDELRKEFERTDLDSWDPWGPRMVNPVTGERE